MHRTWKVLETSIGNGPETLTDLGQMSGHVRFQSTLQIMWGSCDLIWGFGSCDESRVVTHDMSHSHVTLGS